MLMTERKLDKKLRWPLGRAVRLVKEGRLPHILLPDGSIRFIWADIERLIVNIEATRGTEMPNGGQAHV